MKVFDYLHQELSLTVERKVPRCRLWISMAQRGAHPRLCLTPAKAANYLAAGEGSIIRQSREAVGAEKWDQLVQKVRNFDPGPDTPDESMEH